MPDDVVLPLIRDRDGQLVRLPAELALPGDRVRVSRHGDGVLVVPETPARPEGETARGRLEAAFAEIDRRVGGMFMEDGRGQPAMPSPKAGLE